MRNLQGLDRFGVIASYAKYPVAIMVSADHSVIELVDLDNAVTEEEAAALHARGLHFAGSAGLLDGAPEIEMVSPLPVDVAFAVGSAHRQYIEGQRGTATANA